MVILLTQARFFQFSTKSKKRLTQSGWLFWCAANDQQGSNKRPIVLLDLSQGTGSLWGIWVHRFLMKRLNAFSAFSLVSAIQISWIYCFALDWLFLGSLLSMFAVLWTQQFWLRVWLKTFLIVFLETTLQKPQEYLFRSRKNRLLLVPVRNLEDVGEY